jgi:uncharacterized damage-inducible protein DinB
MTLQEAKLLHAFNAWADNRIFEAVALLPDEQYMRDMKSSHGSIHGTLAHMVAAQKIWLSRWLGEPNLKLMTVAELPTLKVIRTTWEKVGFEMAKFLGTMTDRKLQETFSMKTSTGETFTHTYGQAFQHLVDHSSYHRGQVITLMRQLGVRPPGTGMIMFFRETGKLK